MLFLLFFCFLAFLKIICVFNQFNHIFLFVAQVRPVVRPDLGVYLE